MNLRDLPVSLLILTLEPGQKNAIGETLERRREEANIAEQSSGQAESGCEHLADIHSCKW